MVYGLWFIVIDYWSLVISIISFTNDESPIPNFRTPDSS